MKSAKAIAPSLAVLAILVFSVAPSLADDLGYHQIKTDSKGRIVPWYSDDPATSYDFVIRRVWEFWRDMKSCPNGVKYYMQHQVWADPGEDSRGLGGDQICMALSSWSLLYPYLGNREVVENMVYMADYWLDHGLSRPDAAWPNLPFPYNTDLHSGVYDGDMRAGKGYLQPDKAASFGAELVTLFKITGNRRYLKAAIAIADTLVARMETGDGDRSPWPYRVHADTGEVSMPYTANYTGALRLFEDLVALGEGNHDGYAKASDKLTAWLKTYPLRTNKWGPFFEDITGWSNTEINADTMAWYILEHPGWDSGGHDHARRILAWSRATFSNPDWKRYGVHAINEQTAYTVPGNSHTSRHASVQLIYAEKTGDDTLKAEAIRQLNWATYMVEEKGNNRYALDDVWLTDGYGDYVRHYLRAMAAAPELSPKDQDHLLKSTSVVRDIQYARGSIAYETFDQSAEELLRVSFLPGKVTAGGVELRRVGGLAELKAREGYAFNAAGDLPGVLRIRHERSGKVKVVGSPVEGPTSKSDTVRSRNRTHGRQGDVRLRSRTHGNLDQTVKVAEDRPNLASGPGARAFALQQDSAGKPRTYPLPTLNDGDVATSVEAGPRSSAPTEVAVCVVWEQAQPVRQVVFHQGLVDASGGFFDGVPRLLVTSDGTTWTEPTGCSLFPAAYQQGPAGALSEYLFTLPQAVSCRGIQVTGTVGGRQPGASAVLRVRELEVYGDASASARPQIEYAVAHATVAEGQTALMGIRMRGPGLYLYQWQETRDGGRNWSDIPGARGPYLRIKSGKRSEYDGRQYRCAVSDGITPILWSKPATLQVAVPGSPDIHTSNQPMK